MKVRIHRFPAIGSYSKDFAEFHLTLGECHITFLVRLDSGWKEILRMARMQRYKLWEYYFKANILPCHVRVPK